MFICYNLDRKREEDKKMRINFDMDGTIANFYGVENWLGYLKAESVKPYEEAKPLFNFSTFARLLNKAKRNGYEIAVISWTARNGSEEYNKAVAEAKKAWLAKYLPSVEWDEIVIVPYGTKKDNFRKSAEDVLFDDEEPNRKAWNGKAYNVENINEILKEI